METSGVRPYALRKFIELNVLRVAGQLDNRVFRRNVMVDLQESFGINVASSATAYNTAFKEVKQTNPTSVATLGRAEDKKGGRKAKVVVAVAATATADGETKASDFVDAESIVPTLFTVRKKKDDMLIAEGLTFEQATTLVAASKARFKSPLYWV